MTRTKKKSSARLHNMLTRACTSRGHPPATRSHPHTTRTPHSTHGPVDTVAIAEAVDTGMMVAELEAAALVAAVAAGNAGVGRDAWPCATAVPAAGMEDPVLEVAMGAVMVLCVSRQRTIENRATNPQTHRMHQRKR